MRPAHSEKHTNTRGGYSEDTQIWAPGNDRNPYTAAHRGAARRPPGHSCDLRRYLAGPHPQRRVTTPTLTPLPGDQLCEGEDYGLSDSGLALLALLEQGDGGCGSQEDLDGVVVSTSSVAGQR